VTTSRANPTTVVLMGFLGVLLGLIGSVVSAARTPVGSVMLPWGLVLMAVSLGVAVRATLWSTGSRATAGVLLAGWFAASAVVLLVAPGGDVLLPDVPRSYWYLGLAFVLGLLALVWRLPEGQAELMAEERGGSLAAPFEGFGDPVPPTGDAADVR
jgi:hypothetical protein